MSDQDMRYVVIDWLHDFQEEPVRYFHELDQSGYETRKIMVFRSGRMVIADSEHEDDDSFLCPVPIPTLEEINQSPEFQGRKITREDFNEAWSEAMKKLIE